MPAYVHESGERINTVPGSPLHIQMVANAANPGSGWSLDGMPAAFPAFPPPDVLAPPDPPEETS